MMGPEGLFVGVVIREKYHKIKRLPAHTHAVTQQEIDGRTVITFFGQPIDMCVYCGLKVGVPFDPRALPETDDGIPEELALCKAAQK